MLSDLHGHCNTYFTLKIKIDELDENEAEAHRIMGALQMFYRDFEAAEYYYRRAMELNPSDAYIKARSAAFYTFKGEPAQALKLIEAAVAQDPFLPVWCIEERGVALFALGRFAEAQSALRAMSRFKPSDLAAMRPHAGCQWAIKKVPDKPSPRRCRFIPHLQLQSFAKVKLIETGSRYPICMIYS